MTPAMEVKWYTRVPTSTGRFVADITQFRSNVSSKYHFIVTQFASETLPHKCSNIKAILFLINGSGNKQMEQFKV